MRQCYGIRQPTRGGLGGRQWDTSGKLLAGSGSVHDLIGNHTTHLILGKDFLRFRPSKIVLYFKKAQCQN